MNDNDASTDRGFDPDAAPDLSTDGWPEKFARVPVRRPRPPKRSQGMIGLSPEVTDYSRAGGSGSQTRTDDALGEWMNRRDVA